MAREITSHQGICATFLSKHLRLPQRTGASPQTKQWPRKKNLITVHCVRPLTILFHRHCGTAGKLVHAATAALQSQISQQHHRHSCTAGNSSMPQLRHFSNSISWIMLNQGCLTMFLQKQPCPFFEVWQGRACKINRNCVSD